MFATQADEQLVRLETGNSGLGHITLCRSKKLNSLSLPMIHQLDDTYSKLSDSKVRCVILRGEGRALCAGGDVAEVRQGVLNGTRYPAEFFHHEYLMDYKIATLSEKQNIVQVALWDGIVMGGGVGLSIHGPIRIATEKTKFAMPETGIGLFPDVGATWALSRLKAGMPVGLFLGLTGQVITAADCVYAGLATHYCPSEKLGEVEAKLNTLGGENLCQVEKVSAAIDEVCKGSAPTTSNAIIEPNAAAIERCFGNSVLTVEEIVKKLEEERTEWASGVVSMLRQRSPTSVKVTMKAIRDHQSISLREAFIMEYRLSQWCMRKQPESDFCEGIRAVLVDKDKSPKWDPPRFEDVAEEKVCGFFANLPPQHPLGELPL